MTEVVIYSRVSTEEQAQNGFSLQDQERRLREYCARKNYCVIKHYEEEYSAKNFNRPRFNELMHDIESGALAPKFIVCVRPDRFSRHMTSTLTMIEKLQKYKVSVEFIEFQIDHSIPESRLMSTIGFLLPQIENERRGLNTKIGQRQALREGRWMWKAPKGYRNDILTKSIDIGEDADFIIEGFLEVAKGLSSIDAVRRSLNKKGFKCSKQHFINILKNPFYMGKIRIDRWQDEEETVVEGLHEPLVSEEVFNEVQDIIRGKSKNSTKPKKLNDNFPLRGHLLCKKCGGHLTASSSKGRTRRYGYYHCQNGCNERFSSDKANEIFMNALSSLEPTEEVVTLFKEVLVDFQQESRNSSKNEMKIVLDSLNRIVENQSKLDDDFLSRNINSSNYERLTQKLHNERNRLEVRKNEIENNAHELTKPFNGARDFVDSIASNYRKADLLMKQKIVDSIFPEKLIFENGFYRTKSINSFVELTSYKSNPYLMLQTKKAAISGSLSNLAPPLGLEPRTL